MTALNLKPKLEMLRELGFAGVEHDSHVPFLSHLVGTCRILTEWECEQSLCDAGLFHSIYGTEFFCPSELAVTSRRQVAEVIGEQAERIAWLWCNIVRDEIDIEASTAPSRLSGETIQMTKQEVADIATLWAADTVEQIERMGPDERGFARRLTRVLPLATPTAQKETTPFLSLVNEV